MSDQASQGELVEGADPGDGGDDLAQFGYRQELDRTLGKFSSFAAGFSYLSILTGVVSLFGLGFGFAGPGFWWMWPVVFAGQLLVALLFAELAGQFPLSGSVFQWAKQVAHPWVAWLGGWMVLVGSVITLAAVAVGYQVVLPVLWSGFEIIGTDADVGTYSTPDGAKNAIVLAIFLVLFTTIVNTIEKLESFPGLATVALGAIPTREGALRLAEHELTLMELGGIDADAAALGVDLIAQFAAATAIERAVPGKRERGHTEREQLKAAYGGADPQVYPRVARLASALTAPDEPSRRDFAIQAILNGLTSTPYPPTRPTP